MFNCSTKINKTNNTSHLQPFNTKKTTTYGVGNPGPGLKQAQICGRVKPVNGNPPQMIGSLMFDSERGYPLDRSL